MRDTRAYLDYNATAPLRPEARAAMVDAFEIAGNPSSIHAEGRHARAHVEAARRAVGALLSVNPRGVTFTSGGTEAVAFALHPDIAAPGFSGPARRLIISAGEHVCALAGHRFPAKDVTSAPLDGDGRIDLAALERLLDTGEGPALLALQAANNETGVLQPLERAAALVHARGGLLFSDAAQIAGRMPFDPRAAGVDALMLSAHKFGGPKGVGAFVAVRDNLRVTTPIFRGGGQERGARAGTENVAGIAGFGAAAVAAGGKLEGEAERLVALRTLMEARVREAAPDAVVFGERAPRLPNTVCFAAPGLTASTLLMRLDLGGVAASSGSACSSGKVALSHVLAAMGVAPELLGGAIRLSFGWASRREDVDRFGEVFGQTIAALRR